jgi:flagellar basal-body rod protein FlgC
MGMFSSLDIASTGMSAQRLRLDVISNNIANVTTTRNQSGDGPFRRDRVVMTPINMRNVWKSPVYPNGLETGMGRGVKVTRIEKDMSDLKLTWDPTHPDAVKIGPMKGYVQMPNVNVVQEITDMISASRSYEANAQVVMGAKQMFNKALEISKAV